MPASIPILLKENEVLSSDVPHPYIHAVVRERITLDTGSGLLFVRTVEIMHLKANGNYSFVFLENGERHLAAQSLVAFERILPSPLFFRAHQSHIVNTAFVRKLTKNDGLMMIDKSAVPLARRRKELFIETMERSHQAPFR